MNRILLLALVGAFSCSVQALAQEKHVPPVISRGFQMFQDNGPIAAIDTWLVGSARATDDNFQDDVTARIKHVQGFFARMLGFETVRIVDLSPSTRRVYAAVKFEKGVAWMSFDCYRPDKEWIVTRLDFQTNPHPCSAPEHPRRPVSGFVLLRLGLAITKRQPSRADAAKLAMDEHG